MLKEIVEQALTEREPNRWPTYDGQELDRNAFVTASEVGYCLRMIWFRKNSSPTEGKQGKDQPWGFFERGHNVEAWVVEQLRSVNTSAKFLMIGDDQRSLHYENQSGTPDGIMVTVDGNYLFDIKSIDPRTKLSNLPKKEHKAQITQNISLAKKCLGMNFEGGILLYVNASNYQLMYEHEVPYEWVEAAKLTDRARWIMDAEEASDLAPEGIYNGGCTYCDFKSQCSAAVQQSADVKQRGAKHTETAKTMFK